MQKNVIVDGLNLAHRVHHAMKLLPEPLTDEEGNPTGVVVGFLRSLAALKCRFVDSRFHVVWDGSKKRRVSRYSGYKANRSKTDLYGDGQLDLVKKVLSHLNVVQAHSPDEEADDVICSLVRGELKGHYNVIVSTDRDFLQLVSFTNLLLVPKVGGREEILYDPDKVVEEYGVAPDDMVALRAMLGDTSDNLPGVPKVSTKVLTSLLREHKTIDGIFSSSLVGLTAKQYQSLKSTEDQVRLNLELMSLQEVGYMSNFVVDAEPNKAIHLLAARGIQAETIVEPFGMSSPPQGFSKSGEACEVI